MEEIAFSTNWNNKLNGSFFTTIRLRNDSKYISGNSYKITLKKDHLFNAYLVDVRHFKLADLNDFVAGLDTGYRKKDCEQIIRRMYPNVDFRTKELSLILLQRLETP